MNEITAIARVLSSEPRLRIYRMLTERGRAVGEVAQMALLSQATTSWHLARLKEVGLVESHRRGHRTVYKWTRLRFAIAIEQVADPA